MAKERRLGRGIEALLNQVSQATETADRIEVPQKADFDEWNTPVKKSSNSSSSASSNERIRSNGNVGVVIESHRTVTSAGMPLLCVSAEECQASGCNAGGIANRNDGIDKNNFGPPVCSL